MDNNKILFAEFRVCSSTFSPVKLMGKCIQHQFILQIISTCVDLKEGENEMIISSERGGSIVAIDRIELKINLFYLTENV